MFLLVQATLTSSSFSQPTSKQGRHTPECEASSDSWLIAADYAWGQQPLPADSAATNMQLLFAECSGAEMHTGALMALDEDGSEDFLLPSGMRGSPQRQLLSNESSEPPATTLCRADGSVQTESLDTAAASPHKLELQLHTANQQAGQLQCELAAANLQIQELQLKLNKLRYRSLSMNRQHSIRSAGSGSLESGSALNTVDLSDSLLEAPASAGTAQSLAANSVAVAMFGQLLEHDISDDEDDPVQRQQSLIEAYQEHLTAAAQEVVEQRQHIQKHESRIGELETHMSSLSRNTEGTASAHTVSAPPPGVLQHAVMLPSAAISDATSTTQMLSVMQQLRETQQQLEEARAELLQVQNPSYYNSLSKALKADSAQLGAQNDTLQKQLSYTKLQLVQVEKQLIELQRQQMDRGPDTAAAAQEHTTTHISSQQPAFRAMTDASQHVVATVGMGMGSEVSSQGDSHCPSHAGPVVHQTAVEAEDSSPDSLPSVRGYSVLTEDLPVGHLRFSDEHELLPSTFIRSDSQQMPADMSADTGHEPAAASHRPPSHTHSPHNGMPQTVEKDASLPATAVAGSQMPQSDAVTGTSTGGNVDDAQYNAPHAIMHANNYDNAKAQLLAFVTAAAAAGAKKVQGNVASDSTITFIVSEPCMSPPTELLDVALQHSITIDLATVPMQPQHASMPHDPATTQGLAGLQADESAVVSSLVDPHDSLLTQPEVHHLQHITQQLQQQLHTHEEDYKMLQSELMGQEARIKELVRDVQERQMQVRIAASCCMQCMQLSLAATAWRPAHVLLVNSFAADHSLYALLQVQGLQNELQARSAELQESKLQFSATEAFVETLSTQIEALEHHNNTLQAALDGKMQELARQQVLQKVWYLQFLLCLNTWYYSDS